MTRDDEEVMKLRQAFAAPVATLNIEGCPEPDRIWSAVRGELPPAELREIVDHMALCASCAEDWRVAMAFEEEARVRQAAPVVPFRRYRPWVAAAAAVLAISVGVLYIPRGPQGTPGYRGGQDRIEAAVPAGEALPRSSFVVAWKPIEAAESYDLLITTNTLTTVANPKGLTTTSYHVTAGDLAGLPSGTELYWKVTAFDQDGGILSASTFTNRLK